MEKGEAPRIQGSGVGGRAGRKEAWQGMSGSCDHSIGQVTKDGTAQDRTEGPQERQSPPEDRLPGIEDKTQF